jgi:pimeloyl-ACP methyl ester carboxylesterase
MPSINLNGINITYDVVGTGKPLLLIMGLGGDSSHWSLQIPVLAQYYQVITLDNRGAGRSDAPVDGYSIAVMAEDAALLLEHLQITNVHVLGFSMGGYIAQHLALNHPTKIKSLLLSHTAAKSPERTLYLMATLAKMAAEGISRELRIRVTIPWMFSAEFLANEAQLNNLTQLALNPLYPQSKQGYIGQVDAIRQHDTRALIHQLKMPILLLTSREDLLIPWQTMQTLQQQLPHAKLHILERGGHCSYIENAADYNQTILQFLQHLA